MSRKASGECALFKTQVYERCPASFLRDHFGGQGKVRLLTLGRSRTRVGRQKLDGDGEKRLKPKRCPWQHGRRRFCAERQGAVGAFRVSTLRTLVVFFGQKPKCKMDVM